MVLQTSGAISLANIATEFGDSAPHSLSEFYRGGGKVSNSASNANVPTSGQIAFSNFYGAQSIFEVIAEYIVVGGGGGFSATALSGIGNQGGGGGGGGYRSSISGAPSGGGASAEPALVLSSGVTYTVTVGAAGSCGNQGNSSVFHTITSYGGGYGNNPGGTYGSSGGMNGRVLTQLGQPTAGQGYSGAPSNYDRRPVCQFIPTNEVCFYYAAGGGGGAAAAGQTPPAETTGGAGGDGVYSSLLGYHLAGGAGGGAAGGAGSPPVIGTNGAGSGSTANRGGGGHYVSNAANAPFGNGGSGVVVIKVPSSLPNAATVGTVSTFTSGSSKVYVFTTSGTITW